MVGVDVNVFVNVEVGVFVGVAVLVLVGVFVEVAVGAVTVIVKVSVLSQPPGWVLVATNMFVPTPNAMPSISREVDVNPFGPVQLQVPPVKGWGPRLTVVPELTVTLLILVQAPPFT